MESTQGKQSTYDYIVVGGGTSGCALASRLSQYLPQSSIVVVEAGPDITTHPLTQDPFSVFQAHNSDLDWAYQTTPQPHLGNRTLYSAAGKGLGGGSATNYGGWSRGCKLNYDLWAELMGDESWSYENMLPYFKRTENYFSGTERKDTPANHGTNGPVHIASISASDPNRIYPLREPIRAAYAHANLRFVNEIYNDDIDTDPLGVSECLETWLNGKRQISATAYNLFQQQNITILTSTPIQKITIDPSTKRATGVTLTTGDNIHARKEIILSAGTYRTPQLLMLSGIGPASELSRHSIPVVHENVSVGANLHDHPGLYVPYKLHASALNNADNLALGSPGFLSNPAFLKGFPWDFVVTGHSDSSTTSTGTSDIQSKYLTNPLYPTHESFILYAPPGPPLDNMHLPPPDGTIIGGVVVGLATTSRGTVTLSSPSIADPPVINTNSLSTPHDLNLMRTGLRQQLSITLSPSSPLSKIIAHDIPPPGYPALTPDSGDAELDQRILERMQLFFHPGGTAALGTVLDSRMKVMGVQGLRVCDASVMPTPLSAHLMATCYALGERGAEMIAVDSDGKDV